MRLSHFTTILLALTIHGRLICQDFNINKTGLQTFYFQDPQNRNQIIFTNEALVETFNGITTDVRGEISFDPAQLQNTIRGKISTTVNSIKTGIETRDEDLSSERWLNAKKYPEISFEISKVQDVIQLANNKLMLSLVGDFSCRGITKTMMANFTLTLLEENELTKKRTLGDLLSLVGEFEIYLSEYGIQNAFMPTRVSQKVVITVNIVGTNKKPAHL